MDEEISRMKNFLIEFTSDQIQSPTSEELLHVRITNYSLEPGDVTWQVIDWVLNYLENKNCPHSLALSIAKEAAHQVSASVAELCLTEPESDERSFNSSTLYAEAITKLPAICNSFMNQTNLEPSCKSKFATSVFSIKNKRRKMEDRHVIYHDFNALLDLKDAPYHSYYAVFDGHSGVDAASYASAQLHINIAKHPDFLTDTPKAIIEGYQITDLNFLNKCNKWNIKSGCTAVSALIRGSTVYLAWLGDSQAVLIKGGAPVLITSPHKPDREDEKQRIESLGGHISHMGTWRVNGLLAVTRAIGDPDQKRFISGEPELSVVDLDGTEDFLILACDGLWDGLSPEDVTRVLYRHVESSSPDEPLDSIAAKLVHQSKLLGSEDNITVVVVFLRDLEDIKKDASKFVSNSYSVLNEGFMSMNGSMKTHSVEFAGDNSFSKPTVLELNAASSKKLKNAANVMSSAGIGAAAYSYQYVENTSEMDFHSSAMSSSQNAFHSHGVKSSCFPPEATALSELPTPPIDDMLASQQFENFYSTDLYKEMSSSMHASQIDSSVTPVDTDLLSNETSSPLIKESSSQPVESIVDDVSKMSLIDTGNEASANPESVTSSDDAVGLASTVVTTTIETAVKCISSTEIENPNPSPTSQLNPYAKPFVMKSFYNAEESVTSSLVSSVVCDASVNSSEELKADVGNPFVTDSTVNTCSTQLLPDNENLDQLAGDATSPCISGSEEVNLIPSQQVVESRVDSAFENYESVSSTNVENENIVNLQSNTAEQFLNQSAEITNMTNNDTKTEVDNDFIQNYISPVTETDKLTNSENVQELCTFEETEICMKGVIDAGKQEICKEENMFATSEPLIESLMNVDVVADSSSIPDKAHLNDALLVSNLSKEAEINIISPADPNSPETFEQLLQNPSLPYLNAEQSSENSKNSEALQMVIELTTDNSSAIPEMESKYEVSEKVVDSTVTNHPSQTSYLSDNLTDQLLSNVNTREEIKPEYPVQEPESTSVSFTELGLPVGDSVNEVITSKSVTSNIEVESKIVESYNVDKIDKNTVVTSQLVESISSEPISLLDIKNELIPSEAEVPSDPSVEDSHTEAVAVDLKSLPVGIPEAEGVTEDVDSDSEKDGGWSYMKVGDSKSKPESKPSKTSKSNETKPASASKGKTISRPNLEVKNKMKSAVGDRMKNTGFDKTKSLATEKSKIAASVDKTKTVSADKSKTMSVTDKATKNLTATDRVRKPTAEKKLEIKPKVSKLTTSAPLAKTTCDKPTKPAGVSTVRKEASETAKVTSTAKSPRPTTLMRTNVSASKPISTSTVDRSVGSSKIAAKPKVGTTVSENKTATKSATVTSTLSKGTSGQVKPSTTSRITATRPTTSVPATKTSTIARSTLMKSSASETKTKSQSSTVSTVKRTVASTIKKSEMKEVKDNVNKQISAKKTTAVSKVESGSNLATRKVMSATTKSTISRAASNAAKSNGSKKDAQKVPSQKLASKNLAPKASQESSKKEEKKDESAQKTEESKNTLNLENDQKNTLENDQKNTLENDQKNTVENDQKNTVENDQKNTVEIERIADEKFILETSSKEIPKEICEVSVEEKLIDGNLTSAAFPVEDKSPTGECSSESL